MKDFYRELLSSYKLKADNGGFILYTDITYFGAEEPASFYIEKSEDGFLISDKGQTLSYLKSNIDSSRYKQKILDLTRRFGAVIDGNEIKASLPPLETNQTVRALHNFIMTVGIIANIDLI